MSNSPLLASPTSILQQAIRAVPAVKWALAVGGVTSVLAIIIGFKLDYTVAIFGTIILFALMFLMVIFAKLTAVRTRILFGPIVFATWAFLLLIILSSLLFVTCYFFEWPKPMQSLVLDVKQSVRNNIFPAGSTINFASLPIENRTPLDRSARPQKIKETVWQSPSLILDGNTVDLADIHQSVFLKFSRLELGPNSVIRIYNREVKIVVGELIANGGRIESFLQSSRAATRGSDATSTGQVGGNGGDASSAGKLTLIVLDSLQGQLRVDFPGEKAGDGGNGGPGSVGAPGTAGGNSSSHLLDCARGAGNGERGHTGLQGAAGGSGGAGGAGGRLVIYAVDGAVVPETAVNFSAVGGEGGDGGQGGPGGLGGPGGPGGRGSTHCHGGNSGPPGDSGPTGLPGQSGENGREGTSVIRPYGLEQLPDLI